MPLSRPQPRGSVPQRAASPRPHSPAAPTRIPRPAQQSPAERKGGGAAAGHGLACPNKRSPLVAGAFCIPLYVPYVLTGRWIFGRSLCKLWLVVDYLLCTSSVFNIVLISYDRFLSVTRAVSPGTAAERGITPSALFFVN